MRSRPTRTRRPRPPSWKTCSGQCDQSESKFAEAEQHYRKAIDLDPTRVVTFDRLARLLRQDLKNPEAADRVIEGMLKRQSQERAGPCPSLALPA